MTKSINKCDVGIAECDNETIKCEEKKKKLPNVIKEHSYVMLELHNVRIVP